MRPNPQPKWRARVGRRLRFWADRIDWYNAPRKTSWTFTYEHGIGPVFREDGLKGCPLWYLGYDDFDKAHSESDSEQP